MKSLLTIVSASLLAGGLLAAPAFAAGSGASSSGGQTPTCPTGKVYNQQKQTCVDAQSSLDDKSLTTYAYVLAKAGRYDEALQTLDRLKNPNTAEALNYRGYATRKLGRTDEGIGYYLQSVALDPNYTLVREYLGEAYLIKGDLARAKAQLAEIEKRCGTTCEPYGDLAEAIAAVKS
jgi:tetratricopeptide (TPR) repeat protein